MSGASRPIQPGHGRLGAAEQFGDQGLGQVLPQVDQHHQDGPVRADDPAAGRVHVAGGVDVGDQSVDLLLVRPAIICIRDGRSAKMICVVTNRVIYPRPAAASTMDTSQVDQDQTHRRPPTE